MKDTFVFSKEALQTIDADSVQFFKIPSIVLMENAAIGACKCILTSGLCLHHITILCGTGNNGGDGYAVARHLHNAGCTVSICTAGSPKTSDAKTNAVICRQMSIEQHSWGEVSFEHTTLFVDALFGIGLDREVCGAYESIVTACNSHHAPTIALDIPSGLDCETGLPLGCCIEAKQTVTFVGVKPGFLQESARKYTGEIHIAEIGCPKSLVEKYKVAVT